MIFKNLVGWIWSWSKHVSAMPPISHSSNPLKKISQIVCAGLISRINLKARKSIVFDKPNSHKFGVNKYTSSIWHILPLDDNWYILFTDWWITAQILFKWKKICTFFRFYFKSVHSIFNNLGTETPVNEEKYKF